MVKKEQERSLKEETEKIRKWAEENGIKFVESEGEDKAYAVFKPKQKG